MRCYRLTYFGQEYRQERRISYCTVHFYHNPHGKHIKIKQGHNGTAVAAPIFVGMEIVYVLRAICDKYLQR